VTGGISRITELRAGHLTGIISADAHLNGMGITSPLRPDENTSNGRSVAAFDAVPDPGDDGEDVEIPAELMRATKAPPRAAALAATPDAVAGGGLFDPIGCNICHVRSLTTAPAGAVINGGAFVVPAALDGGQSTRNKVRTAHLWGARTRNRLMHDGEFVTGNEVNLAHFGEANPVINNCLSLGPSRKNQVITFLRSL
jgi:CxxC motif-containing protein (DUF1111 family)